MRRGLTKPLVIALLCLAALAAAWSVLGRKQAAPDIAFTTLDGRKHTSQQMRGKVVMVNFWATSCVTCIKEMPAMVQTYDKFKAQGLEFIAVAMQYDPPNYVVNYAETRKLPFKVTLDTTGELARAYGEVRLTPTTYVIDKQGNILKRYVGEPDFRELHILLEKAIAA
jgi:peroxiredoxin